MSSSRRTLNPGDSTVFTTRVAGQPPTTLFIIPWPPNPNVPFPLISWHRELCCQDTHVVETDKVVIPTAGELLTVKNVDLVQGAQVWTDYI